MPPESQSQPVFVDVVELDDPRLKCFKQILARRGLPRPSKVQGVGIFDHETGYVKPAVQVIVDCERETPLYMLLNILDFLFFQMRSLSLVRAL